MEQAGASADVTKGLQDSLKKLETQYERLEKEGKEGFTNSKQVDEYRKRVDKLMNSFKNYERSLGQVGVDITDVMKKSKEVSARLAAAFKNLGFKDIDKATQRILSSQNKLTDSNKVLDKELKARVKTVDDLKDAYDKAAEAANKINNVAISNKYEVNGKNKETFVKKKTAIGSGMSEADYNRMIGEANKAFVGSMQQSSTASDAFKMFEQQSANFSQILTKSGLASVQQQINDYFNTIKQGPQLLQAATDAQNAYNDSVAELETIATKDANGKWSIDPAKVQEVTNATRESIEVERQRQEVLSDNVRTESEMSNALRQVNEAEESIDGTLEKTNNDFNRQAETTSEVAKSAEEAAARFDQLKFRMLSLLSATSVFNLIKKEVKKTYEDVKQLDKSFAGIAMVTDKSVGEMWQSYGHYAQMASQLGQTTDSMIEASALFYQQGLKENEALELTANTMKLATLAGNDFDKATQEMTSAIRGFKMEMSEGAHVTDVYSTLAANAAATVDDIAQAMARTASIANSAGMSFENTSAFLTQMIETTQESAENIGTSLKTIIARFTELKKNVAGTADSEFDDLEYNKVDKALKSVGVSLKDATGQFRNLDEVFLELSEKWNTLDRNTQRYVATIAAGSRQQSRFIAMMDNYDRTVELMDKAANSTGRADQQFAKYADTMEYKLNQIKTKWEEFRVGALSSDTFKGALDGLSQFLDRLKNIDITDLKKIIPAGALGIWAAKTFIKNAFATVKTTGQLLSQAGSFIGTKISHGVMSVLGKGLKKIEIDIDIESLKEKLQAIQSVYEQFINSLPNSKASLQALLSVEDTASGAMAIDQYAQALLDLTNDADLVENELNQLGISLQEVNGELSYVGNIDAAGATLRSLSNEARTLQKEMNGAKQSIESFDAQAAAAKALWSTAASSITMAISAMATGAATFDEAGNMILKSMAMLGGQMVIQAINIGHATGEGFMAGLKATGIGLVIAAVLAAVGLAFKGIQAFIDNYKATHKTLDQQLKEAKAEVEALEKSAKEKETAAKNATDDAKNIEETKNKFEELSQKIIKTQEEQDELNELIAKINSDFPEVVTYYNEMTGELRT